MQAATGKLPATARIADFIGRAALAR